MRIVHEIDYPCQTGGGVGATYGLTLKEQESGVKKAHGFRVQDMIISSFDPQTGKEEVIFLDGDAACILDALEQAVSLVRMAAQHHIEQGDLADDWADLKKRFPPKDPSPRTGVMLCRKGGN